MIHMFWKDCNEPSFYKHICKPNNFMYLNSKIAIYPCVADIVWKYIKENEEKFHKLKKKLIENKKIFQFVYSSSYLRSMVLSRNEASSSGSTSTWSSRTERTERSIRRISIESYFSKSESSLQPPAGAK